MGSLGKIYKTNKEQILDTALFLFHKQGYEATSTRQIAEEVPTSKANVYHHFRTKEGLLHALFEPLFEEVEEWLTLHESPPTGPEGQRAFLEDYLDLVLENKELVFILGSDMAVVSYPEISQPAMRINDRLLELVAGPDSDAESQVRAACALGAIQTLGVRFSQADSGVVREAGLKAALGALGIQEEQS
jgi:AcrR family transcriptional regulator